MEGYDTTTLSVPLDRPFSNLSLGARVYKVASPVEWRRSVFRYSSSHTCFCIVMSSWFMYWVMDGGIGFPHSLANAIRDTAL